jgi:hypothetical protein
MNRNPYSAPQTDVRETVQPDTAGPRPARVSLAVRGFVAIRQGISADPLTGVMGAMELAIDGTALIDFIAAKLGIPKSSVRLAAGATARRKIVEITGVTLAAVTTALR